jgi:eukaryotic-like serine/threonine-protein kinase
MSSNLKQVKDLFDAALSLSPDARRSYLQQACSNADQLREVEELFDLYDQSGNFLETPIASVRSPLDLNVGQMIGPYRLIRELGRGGMGTVFLAERDDFGKHVAIKFLHSEAMGDTLVERFKGEGKFLADLVHPNIARLLDGGSTDLGIPYLVMDYVDGVRIDTYCDLKTLNIRERLKLFSQVCTAVSEIHKKSIVHRDIKPGNILVTTDGVAKLLDFGIAKFIDVETSDVLTSTQIFTPRYASPEQVKGTPTSFGTDIYSLGIVLYELLTGQSPHVHYSIAIDKLLKQISAGEILPPSKAVFQPPLEESAELTRSRATTLKRLQQSLRGDIDSILLKMLNKETKARYLCVDSVIEDIECYLNDRPVIAHSATPFYQVSKFCLRNRNAIAVAALATGIVTGVLFGRDLYLSEAAIQRSVAVLPFENLSPDTKSSYFSDGMTEAVSSQIGKNSKLTVISDRATRAYKNSNKTLRRISEELNVGSIITGSILRENSRLRIVCNLINPKTGEQIWSESFDRPLSDIFSIQNEISRKVALVLRAKLTPYEEQRSVKAPTLNLTAYDYYLKGREYYSLLRKTDNDNAIQVFNHSIKVDPSFAQAYAGLSEAYAQRYEKFGYPKKWLDESIKAGKKAITIDPNLPEGYRALGLAYLFDGQLKEALKVDEIALSLNPNSYSIVGNYGAVNLYLGNIDVAIKYLLKANTLNPRSAYDLTSTAEAYTILGLDREAEDLYMRALIIQPDVHNGYGELSNLFLLQGKYKKATESAQNCLRLDLKNDSCRIALGNIEATKGNISKAFSIYKQITHDLPSSNSRSMLIYLCRKLDKYEEMRKIATGVLLADLNQMRKGSEDAEVAYEIASVYAATDDSKESIKWLRRAIELGWRDYRAIETSPLFSKMQDLREFVKIENELNGLILKMRINLEKKSA